MEIFDNITGMFSDFVNPKKRVFFGYLFLSVLIALGWLLAFRGATWRDSLRRIFDPRIWFSKSGMTDYKIFVINRLFTAFISPLLLTQTLVATGIYLALVRSDLTLWGIFDQASKPLVVAVFSVAMFVADDFTKYLMHRWMHRWPMLWAIHKVHHAAETMTPMTVYRVHPLEGVLYATRNVMAQGPVIAVFYYLFGDTVDLYTILGVNALVFLFHVTGSNLRHSHVDIRYPKRLEYILISPAQHQLHHSIAEEHYDKNYGAALAIWDWMFGSLHVSEGQHDMKFGLLPSENHEAASVKTAYVAPLVEIGELLRNAARRPLRFARDWIRRPG